MIFEYKIPSRRNRVLPAFRLPAATGTPDRAPRVARLVALAHRLEELVRSGAARDYRELARLAQVSPARIAQIVLLAWLAPDLQERILFLSAEEDACIAERELRQIAREPRWDRQRARFEQLLARRT